MPDVTELRIHDLFRQSTATWPRLGELARQALRKGKNECTADAVDDPLSVVNWGTEGPYGTFAVSRDGLHIGFNQYAVAPGACGSDEIVLSWDSLDGDLSEVGRDVRERIHVS
jgi:hypothetical protein